MRLLFLGFVLTFLASCAGSRGSGRELHIQKTGGEARQGARASRDDAGKWSAPSRTETEAVHRMESAIDAAERLQHDEQIPEQEREVLIHALQEARAALERYRAARLDEAARATTLGTIGVAAAAIVADDATMVGVADDPLLIPLALAAMVTVLQANAPSTRDELARAWLDLGHQLEVLRETIALTSPGNVIHPHVVDEARKRAIRRAAAEGTILTESQVNEELLCDELERMARELRRAKKTNEWKKVISTQKGLDCRPSRHSRE
ncbi:hypothetical protein [Archangium violaceum]|nr:hypothetical protein [Archangium violaceum]